MTRRQLAKSIPIPNASVYQGLASVLLQAQGEKTYMGFVNEESADRVVFDGHYRTDTGDPGEMYYFPSGARTPHVAGKTGPCAVLRRIRFTGVFPGRTELWD